MLRVVYGRNRDKAHTIFHGLSQREWILWEACCGGVGGVAPPRELFVDTSRRLGIKAPRETIFDFAVPYSNGIRTIVPDLREETYSYLRCSSFPSFFFSFFLFFESSTSVVFPHFKIPLNFAKVC